MNFVPNIGGTIFNSAAVWAAAIVSVITYTINAMASPTAPDWVQYMHPVALKQSWDWLLPVVSFAAVAFGRVVGQDSMTTVRVDPTTPK